MKTKKHPSWKEAVDRVVDRVNTTGRGCFISHDEILGWFDLEEPSTVEGYKKFSFLRLQYVEQMKEELLVEHNIFLMNDRGLGYVVLHPDDQVVLAPATYMKKALTQIRKAADSVLHVDSTKLSASGHADRRRNLAKLAFLSSTVSSRRLSI